jgi:hypothetical protein
LLLALLAAIACSKEGKQLQEVRGSEIRISQQRADADRR